MTVEAKWNGKLVARSDRTVLVEGNQYFPPEDVDSSVLEASATRSTCPWKGEASYYNLHVGGESNPDAAWYYPQPKDAAARVKDYVAFWHGVEVSGTNDGQPQVLAPARP